ncbi:MAG: MBL fold metallo-hydrolase [Candidatus Pacebacteria bacterium]|nr:MBL fold metallo-hydrolase [Candidatus Paceibacterota bacterium]
MKINSKDSTFFVSVALSKSNKVDIILDPSEKDLKKLKSKADILILSKPEKDIYDISEGGFLISGPGEYEIKEVFINGIAALNNKKEFISIYTIEAEDIKICYLGKFGQQELSEKQLEKINSIDVLMVPVSGQECLSAKQAVKVISQLEPKIIIPTQPENKKSEVKLKDFLKEIGAKDVEKIEQLSFKKSDLKDQAIKIVILKN